MKKNSKKKSTNKKKIDEVKEKEIIEEDSDEEVEEEKIDTKKNKPKKNKKKINIKPIYVVICVLVIVVIVETILLINGKLSAIPTNSNGEDTLVSFNDGTSYTVNEIWDETKKNYGLTVLLERIDKKVLEDKYKDKLSEADEYVKNTENSLKANYVDKNGNYDEDTLLSILQQYGYNSLDEYLNTVRTNYLENLAAQDYAKTLITDDEIQDYYDNKVYNNIDAVHILVKPASDSTDDLTTAENKAKEIIDAIKKDIDSGTSAKDAFAKYKDDFSVTYEDLGSFNYNDMEEAFSKAAYALKTDEYTTEPVKTSYGYHIILKTGEEEKAALSDKKDEIVTTLAKDKVSDDSTVKINAMVNLRNEYGLRWNDSDLENAYDRYINYQINQAKSSSSTSSN